MAIGNSWNDGDGALRRWGKQIGAVFAKRGTKAAILVAFLVGALWWLWPLPPQWWTLAYWQEGGTSVSRSEIVRNSVLMVLAFFGLVAGIWRAYTAYRQVNVAEQGLFTERFSRAAEHLGSKQLPVRLGGIYALWRLAGDSTARDTKAVIDILCAFVRNPPHEPAELASVPSTEPTRGEERFGHKRPDVQAIMNLIGEKDAAYRRHIDPRKALNFTGADLTDAYLLNANLSGAVLRSADFSGADLRFVNLSRAVLVKANLSRAVLLYANLSGADLRFADFSGADLANANLSAAKKRLRQNQLEAALPTPPPKSLPDGLTWPFVEKDGKWVLRKAKRKK